MIKNLNNIKNNYSPEELDQAASEIPAICENIKTPEDLDLNLNNNLNNNNSSEIKNNKNNIINLSHGIKLDNGEIIKHIEIKPEQITASLATKAERIFKLKVPDFPKDENFIESPTFWQIIASLAININYKYIENLPMAEAWSLGAITRNIFLQSLESLAQEN